jgi:hypothetical protein
VLRRDVMDKFHNKNTITAEEPPNFSKKPIIHLYRQLRL